MEGGGDLERLSLRGEAVEGEGEEGEEVGGKLSEMLRERTGEGVAAVGVAGSL